jgi:hypothetical protein
LSVIGHHGEVRIAQAALAVTAVVIGAWFVIGARQAHEIDQATKIIAKSYGAAPAERARAASLLSSAAFLYPGQDVPILKARLAISDKNLPRAQSILRGVTRAEPLNLQGWIWLTGALLPSPKQAKAAGAHIVQLDPADARALNSGLR